MKMKKIVGKLAITSIFFGVLPVYAVNFNSNYTDKPSLNIGVMVGEKYADYCSFSTPADSKKFVFDNNASWRFIFSSSLENSAHMRLNGKIVQLRLVRTEENKTSQTIREFYKFSGDSRLKVEVIKTAINTSYESTTYRGILLVEKNGVVKEVSFVGDCGS